MKTFEHEAFTIAYTDKGSGPTVLMLHNGGTSSTIWRHQASDLATENRVITLDLPGFGQSPRPAVAPTLTQMVDLVAALLEEEVASPALVVGNCMGTNIASRLSREYPHVVTGVLAINPLTEVSFSGGHIGFLHTMKRKIWIPTKAFRAFSRHVRTPKFIAPLVLRFQLGPKGVAQKLHHDRELIACQLRADQLPALIDVLDDMNAYGGIDSSRSKQSIPTWIIWGDKNRVLSRAKSAHLRESLSAERVEVIDGCGHLVMLENPERVNELIRELLDRTKPETKEAAS